MEGFEHLISALDALVWFGPTSVSQKLEAYRDSTNNCVGRYAASIVNGVIDGLSDLHHLPSLVEYKPSRSADHNTIGSTTHRLEKYIRSGTIVLSTAAYGYFTYKWSVFVLAPPVVSNIMDGLAHENENVFVKRVK